MLKIIHLIPRNGIGGVETAARSMLGSKHPGFDFQLVLITGETLEMGDDGSSDAPLYSENNIVSHLRALKRVVAAKPDVLVCSLWRSLPVGLGVKLIRRKTKLVFFLHFPITIHLLDTWLSKLFLRFCDACWSDSQATIDARIGPNKGMRNRVVSFITGTPPESLKRNRLRPKFVFWGRLHRQKGLDRSLTFISKLIESGCEARYKIWGPDAGERSELMHLIEAQGLQHAVSLMGPAHYADLNQIAEQNAFYLQLSRDEGMAMSVVEAMQRGLVPVVTPVGEIATYCTDGQNSVIVRNVDDPVAAVDTVMSLIKVETTYRQYQSAAQQYWEKKILYREDFYQAVDELFL